MFGDWSKGKPEPNPAPPDWTGAPAHDLPVTDAALLPKFGAGAA